MAGSSNAGCSSTPSPASPGAAHRGQAAAASKVSRKSKPSRQLCRTTLPVKPMPSRPWRPLRRAYRRPSCPEHRPSHPTLWQAGATSARHATRPSGLSRSQAPSPPPSRPVRPSIDQQSCFILATNELDDTLLSPQELFSRLQRPEPMRNAGFVS